MADPDCSRPARPRRSRPLAGSLLALLLLAPAAHAQPADALVALRLDWLTHLAREDAATAELKALAALRSPAAPVGNVQDPAAVLAALGPALDADYKQVRAALGRVEEKARARKADALKDWTEAYRQRVAFREAVGRLEAAHGFDFETGTSTALRPDPVDALALVAACFVAVVAVRLRRTEQRLDIRKARRAAGAAVLLIAVALPGCGGPPPGDARPWAAREEAELTSARDAAASNATSAETAAEQKWQAPSAAWVALVTALGGDLDTLVRTGEAELRTALRAVAVDAQLAERLVKDAAEQRAKLAEEAARLDQITGRAKLWSRAGSGLRVLAACALLGLATAPLWAARRSRARRIALAAKTCPRCFRLDTLKVEGAGKKAAEDDDGDVRCTRCGLRFRRSYLDVPRLCFPTVGVRSSGKTHMLVTAYDRVRKRTAPTAATVQPAPTGSDADRRFEQLTDEVLHRRGVAGATDLVLPDPILLHVRDADPAGPSAALVNLFDYSGELINPDVDVNMLKATAVRMDGFMLFLDPTQLYGDAANVTVEQQLAMLDAFLAHMRKERRVPVGEPVPVPVAVCVPKFDLLISDNPIGGQSVQYIRQMLEHLNPPPQEVTLAVLRERSELVEQMLPLMFPGLDVRRLIEGYFGPQLLFFPLSSVGLIEHELGVKDLSKRTIAPFGTSEPVVWLLHMHGYSVFG
ncbi:unnamed protein product [Gemmataceae bacterium]|nr:unnamed protein product [Gemmataceae bacterium]VTU00699.1 unnamed protein product [Gemmataceae bacterium]